jgi:hypothetical protein
MRAATSKLREMPWLVASMTGAPPDESAECADDVSLF